MKYIFTICYLFFSFKSKSQINVVNQSLRVDKKILYMQIENYISVFGLKSGKDIYVRAAKSKIDRYLESENKFIVKPTTPGLDTLYVFKGPDCIATQIFKVETFGNLQCTVGDIKNKTAFITEIVSNPVLTIYIPDSYLQLNRIVLSFKAYKIQNKDTTALYDTAMKFFYDTVTTFDPITFKEKEEVIISYGREGANNGNKLTEYQIEEIKKLKPGDKLLFTNIKASCASGRTVTLKDFEIVIK